MYLLQDFPGDSYSTHTSCISENEKYGGKDYRPKASANKGQHKQDRWMAELRKLVADAAGGLDWQVREVIDLVLQQDNVPRKRAKFVNFVKNIARRVRPAAIEETWDFFEKAIAKSKEAELEPKKEASGPKMEQEADNGLEEKVQTGTQESESGSGTHSDEVEMRLGIRMFTGTKNSLTDKAHESSLTVNGKSKKKKKTNLDAEDVGPVENGVKSKKRRRQEEQEDLPAEEGSRAPPKKSKKREKEKAREKGLKNKVKGKENLEEAASAEDQDESGCDKKFVWSSVLEELLRNHDGQMKAKRLKKKALAAFMEAFPATHLSPEQLSAKLEKRIQRSKNLRLMGDQVKLKE